MDVETFWQHVDKSNLKGCWPWTGPSTVWYQGKNHTPSSLAYFLATGQPTFKIRHTCHNVGCCRPEHILPDQTMMTTQERIHNICPPRNYLQCWLWPGATNRGLPVIRIGGKLESVRRLMLAINSTLDLGSSLRVGDTCGDRRCINPFHLYIKHPRRTDGYDDIKRGTPRRRRRKAGGW